MSDDLPGVPARLLEQLREATPSVTAQSILRRLPDGVRVRALVGAQGQVPRGMAELLKVVLLAENLMLVGIEFSEGDPVEVQLRWGDRLARLGSRGLEGSLDAQLFALLTDLLGPMLPGLIEGLAASATAFETLGVITSHMLRSSELDRAHYLMLSGITSGYALGFNRAALFLWDAEREVLRGARAIGPADAREAHEIWESLRQEDLSIEDLIEAYNERDFDSPFERFVRELVLEPGLVEGDELRAALEVLRPRAWREHELVNETLRPLATGAEFVLARVGRPDRVRGLLFADNLYDAQPIGAERLHRLGFFVDQTSLIWDNLVWRQQIEYQATHDALTGVLNRHALDEHLRHAVALCRQNGDPCGLILLDLDHFKELNDTEGHQAGDAHLVELAEALRESVRREDALGRYGGDEFLIVSPRSGPQGLRRLLERLGERATAAGISLSMGASSAPAAGPYDELLSRADAQLYRAKEAGRGCAFLDGESVEWASSGAAERP